MNPVKLLIQRKTKVPTKHQNVHLFRSDWKKVYIMDYNESTYLFKSLKGYMETDSQFCSWLYKNFGEGTYSIIAWKKGRKGFYSFMKVELLNDRFKRLPKTLSKEDIELQNEIRNKKELAMQVRNNPSEENTMDLEVSQDIISDIKDDVKKTKRGCYPYLKSVHPVYSYHSYDYDFEPIKEEEFKGKLI